MQVQVRVCLLSGIAIIGALAYGSAWVAVSAAYGSRNADSYAILFLLTLPAIVLSAAGWVWAWRRPNRGSGLLLTIGGLVMAGWGLFVAIDMGPGWLLAGLVILASGIYLLRRGPAR